MKGSNTGALPFATSYLRRNVAAGSMLAEAIENTVVALGGLHEQTEVVVLQVIGGTLRYTDDGSEPAPTHGFQLYDGAVVSWEVEMARVAKFIRENPGAVSAVSLAGGQYIR